MLHAVFSVFNSIYLSKNIHELVTDTCNAVVSTRIIELINAYCKFVGKRPQFDNRKTSSLEL